MKRRQPPLMWQGEVMESIVVHKDNESLPEFELEISPYNCAHDLSLVKVCHSYIAIFLSIGSHYVLETEYSNVVNCRHVHLTCIDAAKVAVEVQ